MQQEDSVQDRRFLTLDEVRKVLTISKSQAYALVRSGDLRAIPIGGRRQWRIDAAELDAYIHRSTYRPSRDNRTELRQVDCPKPRGLKSEV